MVLYYSITRAFIAIGILGGLVILVDGIGMLEGPARLRNSAIKGIATSFVILPLMGWAWKVVTARKKAAIEQQKRK